jgi:hypothetical protein
LLAMIKQMKFYSLAFQAKKTENWNLPWTNAR